MGGGHKLEASGLSDAIPEGMCCLYCYLLVVRVIHGLGLCLPLCNI